MGIVNSLLGFIATLMGSILPVLGVPDSFFANVDTAFSWFILLMNTVSWLIPMDILLACFSVMVIADNFALVSRLAQWVIKLIRG